MPPTIRRLLNKIVSNYQNFCTLHYYLNFCTLHHLLNKSIISFPGYIQRPEELQVDLQFIKPIDSGSLSEVILTRLSVRPHNRRVCLFPSCWPQFLKYIEQQSIWNFLLNILLCSTK